MNIPWATATTMRAIPAPIAAHPPAIVGDVVDCRISIISATGWASAIRAYVQREIANMCTVVVWAGLVLGCQLPGYLEFLDSGGYRVGLQIRLSTSFAVV